MAARKPRNFAQMREDRVIAMAAAHFNRQFHDKASAVRALSKLAVKEQHGLPKPRLTPGAQAGKPATRTRSKRQFNNELRGGVAPPTSTKLAEARADVVKRYARATIGIEAKSKAQALTLMAKLGPTDVARAAGGAIGRGGMEKPGPAKPILRPVAQAAAPVNVRPRGSLRLALAGAAAGAVMVMAGRSNAAGKEAPVAENQKRSSPESQAVIAGTGAALVSGGIAALVGSIARAKFGPVVPVKTVAAGVGAAFGITTAAGVHSTAKAEGAKPAPAPQPAPESPSLGQRVAQGAVGALLGGGVASAPAAMLATAARTPKGILGAMSLIPAGMVWGAVAGASSSAKAEGTKPAPAPAPAAPASGGSSLSSEVGKSLINQGASHAVLAGLNAMVKPQNRISFGARVAIAAVSDVVAKVTTKSSPAPGAFMNDAAKAKADAADAAPRAAPRPAAQADTRATGPIEVPGYTRADGVQVKGYTRARV